MFKLIYAVMNGSSRSPGAMRRCGHMRMVTRSWCHRVMISRTPTSGIRELLNVLTVVEERPADDIIVDINAPLDDIQSFRTFPEGMPQGFTSLATGIRALRGVQSMIGTAARTVFEGPLPEFPAGTPSTVSDLLQRVQLGPGRPGSYVFTVRMPVDTPSQSPSEEPHAQQDEPIGRRVSRRFTRP